MLKCTRYVTLSYAGLAQPLTEHLTEAYEFSDMRAMWQTAEIVSVAALPHNDMRRQGICTSRIFTGTLNM